MNMQPNKVWCKECYEKWVKLLDEKYGDGWYFSNLETRISLEGNVEYIAYPPSLKIRVKHKKKNGEYSDSKTNEIDLDVWFCPFCGRQITPKEIVEE